MHRAMIRRTKKLPIVATEITVVLVVELDSHVVEMTEADCGTTPVVVRVGDWVG